MTCDLCAILGSLACLILLGLMWRAFFHAPANVSEQDGQEAADWSGEAEFIDHYGDGANA